MKFKKKIIGRRKEKPVNGLRKKRRSCAIFSMSFTRPMVSLVLLLAFAAGGGDSRWRDYEVFAAETLRLELFSS